MIDAEGYRLNVGIILCNQQNQVLWAKRAGQNAWQFPQGGIREKETAEQALLRELWEEVGLQPKHIEILGRTQDWLHYQLPRHMVRQDSKPVCIGQKQRWFLLRLIDDESNISLDSTERPEFDYWKWVDYWFPLEEVVPFKKSVYQSALDELHHLLFNQPPRAAAPTK